METLFTWSPFYYKNRSKESQGNLDSDNLNPRTTSLFSEVDGL